MILVLNDCGYIACLMRKWKLVSPRSKNKTKTKTNSRHPLKIWLLLFAYLNLIMHSIASFYPFSSNTVFKTEMVFYLLNSVRDILSQAIQIAILLYVFKCIWLPFMCILITVPYLSKVWSIHVCLRRQMAKHHPWGGHRWWPGRAVASVRRDRTPRNMMATAECRLCSDQMHV